MSVYFFQCQMHDGLLTPPLISTKLCTNHSWVKGMQVCANEGSHLFPKGDDNKKANIPGTLMKFKIFFFRTTVSISTKLGTKHPWMMGIHVCSNERPRPFPRGDNYEITKIHVHWQHLRKSSFLEQLEQFQLNLA